MKTNNQVMTNRVIEVRVAGAGNNLSTKCNRRIMKNKYTWKAPLICLTITIIFGTLLFLTWPARNGLEAAICLLSGIVFGHSLPFFILTIPFIRKSMDEYAGYETEKLKNGLGLH